MPLSEHEQRALEEIERNLYAEDSDFARGMNRADPSLAETKRVKLGFLSFIGGLLTLLAFFVTRALPLGVLAFAAMVAGIVIITTATRNLVSAWRMMIAGPRDRINGNLKEWERRMRDRYRRHKQ